MCNCMWASGCQFTVNVSLPAHGAFFSLVLNIAVPKKHFKQREAHLELHTARVGAGAPELLGRARSAARASVALPENKKEMDADGSTKRTRRPTKKLKFKPKVPPQKPRKLTVQEREQEQPVPVDEELMKILKTPQKDSKTLPKTKESSLAEERPKQSPPSTPPSAAATSLSPPQSGANKQSHSVTLQSPTTFPVAVNPGVFYNKEEYIDEDEDDDDDDDDEGDNVEFQENQQSSTECEASTRPAEELGLLHENKRKERMFLFQLPKTLPLPRPSSSVVERKGKASSREVKEGSNLQQLPQGYFGKMLVYKSGKIKMKIGDVMFDVNPGAESRMVQHAVAVNCKEKHCCLVGEIENRHVIVTPDVNSLLNDN